MQDRDALRRRLWAAFASAPRPMPAEIAPHRCPECDALRDDVADYTAEGLPLSTVTRHAFDLPLLSAVAKHYYLPSWLCAALEDSTGNIAAAAMEDIDAGERYDPPGGYTDEQWECLHGWLDYVSSLNGSVR